MIKKNASDKYVLTAEDAELLARFYMQSAQLRSILGTSRMSSNMPMTQSRWEMPLSAMPGTRRADISAMWYMTKISTLQVF